MLELFGRYFMWKSNSTVYFFADFGATYSTVCDLPFDPNVIPAPVKTDLDPDACGPALGSTASAPCSFAFLNMCFTKSAPSFFLAGPKICCPLVSDPPA